MYDQNDPLAERLEQLIRDEGEPEQVQHLESGMMAREDQLQVARDILFSPAGAWPRYQPRAQRHIRTSLVRQGLCGDNDPISWDTVESKPEELSGEERMRLEQLEGLLPEAKVEAVDHVALCGRGRLVFRGAQVVFELVPGTTVMREFRLDTDPETERLFESLQGLRGSTPPNETQARYLLTNRGNPCGPNDPVTYEIVEADTVTTDEHRRLARIRELAPAGATVRAIWFVVSCGNGQLRRTAAEVSCPVYTGVVSKHYRLDVEPTR